MNKYIGNTNQIYGVEEVRLVGGKGDGMRFFNVRNGKGLDFSVSLDRCADISRLSFKGDNMSYFSPSGYVSPSYYDGVGMGFLKSFTAGFFTTCGLTAVGSPCTDEGEELPLHGTISNTPAENAGYWVDDDAIHIKAVIRDAAPFGHKLILEREYIISLTENKIVMNDVIKNIGSSVVPFEILYHCNMGYPLLSEDAEITIPSTKVTPRNDHAASGIDTCLVAESPQSDYEEMCFYHKLEGQTSVSIYNKSIKKGVSISYDTAELPFFTQWKMMGEYEYVMGLEPGNCTPDGRDVVRQNGNLQFISPGDKKKCSLTFTFVE